MVLVRLKISAALSARALLGESEPVVPALPISSVPLETVVVPVYVLGPLKISRPVPVCARPSPLPPSPIALEKTAALPAVVALTLVVRLYVTPVPEGVTGPGCGSSPVAVRRSLFAGNRNPRHCRLEATAWSADLPPPASGADRRDPLVTVPLVGVELTVGTLTEPADNVVPPE